MKFIGIWPVGYAGYLRFEGPVCVNGGIVEWSALFAPQRYPYTETSSSAISLFWGEAKEPPLGAYGFNRTTYGL